MLISLFAIATTKIHVFMSNFPCLFETKYRGDTAFCSQECREQRIKQDERKEKYNMAASKKVESHHNEYSELTTAASESSGNSETVAAA